MNKEVHVILAVAGIIAGILTAQGCSGIELSATAGVHAADTYKHSSETIDRPHGIQCLWKDCTGHSNESQGS